MTAFMEWITTEAKQAPHNQLSALLPTAKGLNALWDFRPPLPLISAAMELAGQLVVDLKADDSSVPLLRHKAARLNELRLTIDHSPTPGVLAWGEENDMDLRIVVEEGLTRLLHTVLSLGAAPQLDNYSAQHRDRDLFLTGAFHSDDFDAMLRAAAAYAGLLRETGGAYLPLVPVHSLRSSVTGLWMLTGCLCFVLFHEIGHWLSKFDDNERSPVELEAHCDWIAASLCMLSFGTVEEPVLGLLGLAGSLLLPRILGLAEDVRFLVPPRSHPEARARVEFVEEVFRTHLPDRVFDGVTELAADREGHLVLNALIGELDALDWRPRSEHHLANCLRPDGPIQILLSRDGIDSFPPGALNEGLSAMCSLAITGSEELARRRTLSSYNQYASMGAELCRARPRVVLDTSLFNRAVDMLKRQSPEIWDTISKLPASQREDSIDTYVAAVIGQHYYWAEFIRLVVPALARDDRSLQVHGVSHDVLSRMCASEPPQLLLAATYRLDRSRHGDDFILPVDEELAGTLLRASRSST